MTSACVVVQVGKKSRTSRVITDLVELYLDHHQFSYCVYNRIFDKGCDEILGFLGLKRFRMMGEMKGERRELRLHGVMFL